MYDGLSVCWNVNRRTGSPSYVVAEIATCCKHNCMQMRCLRECLRFDVSIKSFESESTIICWMPTASGLANTMTGMCHPLPKKYNAEKHSAKKRPPAGRTDALGELTVGKTRSSAVTPYKTIHIKKLRPVCFVVNAILPDFRTANPGKHNPAEVVVRFN